MSDGVTRRGALAAGASVVGGLVASGRARAQSGAVTVATRNCYLGADLFRLLAATATDDQTVEAAVSDLLQSVDRSQVAARLDGVATELGRTEPALVGIQEAPLIRTGEPTADTTPTATDVRHDFRERLATALDDRGLPYRVVSAVETTDFQLPTTIDGERRAVRLTDRDLLLAHERASTAGVTTGTFDAAATLADDGRSISLERGYGVVDATVGDQRLTFCNTHLESVSAETRLQQAAELESLLAERRDPVVLVGDLNSSPGDSAYDRLTETFRDAASGVGNTCCHPADLRSDAASLTERVDHVLVRGALRAGSAERVGADPDSRIAVGGDRLWPSDHAGVVATLAEGTPTATAMDTATATDTATNSSTSTAASTEPPADSNTTAELAGFGGVTGLAAVVVAALAARRRGEDD
ncbi:Endonuclease/Exonuclease/phosphatase family protein [Haloplanus vescus]|uniref:Endonuclease/Exonuclease/phosphatase family protein n=1 Tax=Haloplanus vescus TaxID=555874 RepID=A0A1H3WX05_9EURY|nr:endonuclease/exonuclease/phosphatase family protein [Haloplanus vescus]SDZ91673.1 Endonuclease/Exonuclease/phosphatase family protein [Haloplanus vescus]